MEKYSRVLNIISTRRREMYVDPTAFNVAPVTFATAPDLTKIATDSSALDLAASGQADMYKYLASADATNLATSQALIDGDVAINQAIQNAIITQSADEVEQSRLYQESVQNAAKEQTAQLDSTNAAIGKISEDGAKTLTSISKDQSDATQAGYKYVGSVVDNITKRNPILPTSSTHIPPMDAPKIEKSDIGDTLNTLFSIVSTLVILGLIFGAGYYAYIQYTENPVMREKINTTFGISDESKMIKSYDLQSQSIINTSQPKSKNFK